MWTHLQEEGYGDQQEAELCIRTCSMTTWAKHIIQALSSQTGMRVYMYTI